MTDKPKVIQKPPGWLTYIKASNETMGGSVVALIIGLGLGYLWGYYVKYKDLKTDNIAIVVQADANEKLDIVADKKQDDSKNRLNDSLTYLGYSEEDIEYLITGKARGLDGLKRKFTKYVKGDTVYLPRDDCGDDYLGIDSANEANQIIMNGFMNRYKAND